MKVECAEEVTGVEPISIPFPAEKLNGRSAAILVAQLAKHREQILDRRAVREAAVQDANPPPLRCQRRCCGRRGEQPSKEVTPSHSMTSCARLPLVVSPGPSLRCSS